MDWHQLWEIVSAPDNVPIVAMIFLVPFYTWYGLRQAIAAGPSLQAVSQAGMHQGAHHLRQEADRNAGPLRDLSARELAAVGLAANRVGQGHHGPDRVVAALREPESHDASIVDVRDRLRPVPIVPGPPESIVTNGTSQATY